jgi:hypothetical protein
MIGDFETGELNAKTGTASEGAKIPGVDEGFMGLSVND